MQLHNSGHHTNSSLLSTEVAVLSYWVKQCWTTEPARWGLRESGQGHRQSHLKLVSMHKRGETGGFIFQGCYPTHIKPCPLTLNNRMLHFLFFSFRGIGRAKEIRKDWNYNEYLIITEKLCYNSNTAEREGHNLSPTKRRLHYTMGILRWQRIKCSGAKR